MAENPEKAKNPKKFKIMRNVGIISAIGAIIMFIVRIYFNSELNKIKSSGSLIVKIGTEEMTRGDAMDVANEIISKCTTAAIIMLAIAVVLIALYIVVNKKKSDE